MGIDVIVGRAFTDMTKMEFVEVNNNNNIIIIRLLQKMITALYKKYNNMSNEVSHKNEQFNQKRGRYGS